ncbi:hypothetical protein FRC04_005980 [Tulasnella sp. 424]|nr:hypothetical protein FRC04_005980 [Tulasnella sp. 424]KAG8960410.1 hypothetical protein FRC05_006853 [Tulasnella sp. 425]
MSIFLNGPLTFIQDGKSPHFSLPTSSLPNLELHPEGAIPRCQGKSNTIHVTGILQPCANISDVARRPLSLRATSWVPASALGVPTLDNPVIVVHGTVHHKQKESQAILMSIGDGSLQVRLDLSRFGEAPFSKSLPYGKILQAVGHLQDIGRNTDGFSILITVQPSWISHHEAFNKPTVLWPLPDQLQESKRRSSSSIAQSSRKAAALKTPTTPATPQKPTWRLPTPESSPRKRKERDAPETRMEGENKRIKFEPEQSPLLGSRRRRVSSRTKKAA